MPVTGDQLHAFLTAASAPMDALHVSGTLDAAQDLLAALPELAEAHLFCACVLGEADGVERWLASDPGLATRRGGPHGWDALTYLCFSRYLRLDRSRAPGFRRAAELLMAAGADATTGFREPAHQPEPMFESVLYGAAGLAHDADLTALLVAHGADPNDVEVAYHTPESYDNGALEVLVESGRLTTDSLAVMLVRKADWHDHDGLVYLLAHGADPNARSLWGPTPLQHAVRRDNALATIAEMLDHGADVRLVTDAAAGSALSIAARRGRADLLAELEQRGVSTELSGVDGLIAACARGDETTARALAAAEPRLLGELRDLSSPVLLDFAGVGNDNGVRLLLELGCDIAATLGRTDGYWGLAAGSTALHVAAWRMRPSTVSLLLDHGAPVNRRNEDGETALMAALRACVQSHWSARRTTAPIAALLAAGADLDGVRYPSGYAAADALLAARGATP